MRRAPALFVVVGVVAGLTGLPVQAQTTAPVEGFWVSLAAGTAGSSLPSSYNEFWFDSPHAPPVSVTQATGITSVQATTGGGSTIFTGAGTPVLIPTTDGYATISSGATFPSSALPRFAGGSLASGAPLAGGLAPSSATLMSLGVSSPAANGSETLTVAMSTQSGTSLGSTSVTVPNNGWWVVGLGAGAQTSISDPVGPTPVPVPTGPVVTNPGPGSGGNLGNTAASPEPASFLLVGLGGLSAAGWRRWRK